jgi:hypothetical protein
MRIMLWRQGRACIPESTVDRGQERCGAESESEDNNNITVVCGYNIQIGCCYYYETCIHTTVPKYKRYA